MFFQKRQIITVFFIAIILEIGFAKVAFAIPAMYERCKLNSSCQIGEYVFADDGYTPITTDNFCQITITDANDTIVVNNQNMPDKNDGWYYYNFTATTTEGTYRSIICCDSGANRRCLDKTFIVGTPLESVPEKVWSYTSRTLTAFGSLAADIWNDVYAPVRKLTSRQIGTSTEEIARQYDVELIRQATFDFAGFADSGSTTTLTDAELTQPDGYWNNYSLIMMSGNNIGQKRSISSFASSTITVSSAFPYAIAAGDKYVISHEDKLVNAIWNYTSRTLTSFGTLVSDIWGYSNRSLTTFGTLVSDIWSNSTRTLTDYATSSIATAVWSNPTRTLTDFGTLVSDIWGYSNRSLTTFGNLVSDIWSNSTRTLTDYATSSIATAVWSNPTRTLTELGALAADIWNDVFAPTRKLTSRQIGTSTEYIASQATLEAVRSSQQEGWTIYLSDIGQLLAGKTYRAKITILNYESVPTDPFATSTVTIYDASRNIVVENVQMTKLSTGVYEYTYNIPSSAGAGLWETVVSTEVESGKVIKTNDYWEVEASPAEVKINQITDNTIPSITANAVITNEGSSGYEYQYEYCIVSSLENQCGGGDDIDYAKAAKYIQAGESWTTNLTLNVSNEGTYYFKVVVYWGTERSVAYKQFEAVKEVVPPSGGGGGGAITPSKPPAPACKGPDLNFDGIVQSTDFSILLYHWKKKPPFLNLCADINKDNKVDSIDFSIMLYWWNKKYG